MQHVTLKAATTATDQELGTFTALVSAWDADREGDVIERTAFDQTIRAWQDSGKNVASCCSSTASGWSAHRPRLDGTDRCGPRRLR